MKKDNPRERLNKILAKIEEEGNEKVFFYKDYRCLIRRLPDSGHLCGYVGLEKNHRFYGAPYTELEDIIVCHGGLTFGGFWSELGDDRYYIGFDCAHAYDLRPFVYHLYPQIYSPDDITAMNETYRDMEYVEKEIKDMVDQLIRLEKKKNVKEVQ